MPKNKRHCESLNNNKSRSTCRMTFNRCYNDHFNNPQENYIRPYAPKPKRQKFSDASVMDGDANNNANEAAAAAQIEQSSSGQNLSPSQNALDTGTQSVKKSQEDFLGQFYARSESGTDPMSQETSSVWTTYTEAPSRVESKSDASLSTVATGNHERSNLKSPAFASSLEQTSVKSRKSLISVRKPSTPAATSRVRPVSDISTTPPKSDASTTPPFSDVFSTSPRSDTFPTAPRSNLSSVSPRSNFSSVSPRSDGSAPGSTGSFFPDATPSARSTGTMGDRHTQAPDDFNDPPIITPQETPSLNVVNERKTIFNPRVMPAWAEEFLATRCGKVAPFPNSTEPYVVVGSVYTNNYGSGRALGGTCCEEILSKYMNSSQLEKDDKDNAKDGKETPASSKASKTNAPVTTPAKKKDEPPGCCKCCCCCSWCCLWDSWIIWLFMLVAVLMLVYLIWWKGCGLEVLVLEDISDWGPSFLNDIFGVEFFMQLFLSTLGYFAYFLMICLCYVWCKTCALPNDPKGLCSCKEIKLIIHMIYGVVLIIFLHRAIEPWQEKKEELLSKTKNPKQINHVFECLELCLWDAWVIFFLGIIAFLIFSLERRKIRKRIASLDNPADEAHPQQRRPEPGQRPPPGTTGQLLEWQTNSNNMSKSMLLQSVYVDHVRPMFYMPPPTRTRSQYGFCDFHNAVSPYNFRRDNVNTACSC